MWLAVIMVCQTPQVTSCTVIANEANIFYTLEQCQENVNSMVTTITAAGFFAKPTCFKVGDFA